MSFSINRVSVYQNISFLFSCLLLTDIGIGRCLLRRIAVATAIAILFSCQLLLPTATAFSEPIYIAFLWHMHQPIYWPYESIVDTEARGVYDFSLYDVHDDRAGPYTDWPIHAVETGMSASGSVPDHFGAQVSFSGSLMENLDNLKDDGDLNFATWESRWIAGRGYTTTLGNPRVEMVAFGHHHPIMPLIDPQHVGRQMASHRTIFCDNFGCAVPYSRGLFPPENSFGLEAIPGALAQGVEWVMVDNIHLQRACLGYPWNSEGSVVEPNVADQVNPDPGGWVSLSGLWAPTQVSAPWSYRPHLAEYVDPATGESHKIIVVPTARYMGNEDSRGGFGALQYETVMSQLEPYNSDPDHPLLIVLHHDGDNHGGGSHSYYHSNFDNFVDWLEDNPTRFVCTTIEDYLEMFPPDSSDLIHLEDGSWVGADGGDPEFHKWNGDPYAGYSSDRNSWACLVAAANRVETAQAIDSSDTHTQEAWRYLLNGQASDYFYWDGVDPWDSHPTRAANLAVGEADQVVGLGSDTVGPTVFPPQREPYNPGGNEWGVAQPADFTVWTLVYDLSGVAACSLKYRVDGDGINSQSSHDNETYAGGPEVGTWQSLPMTGSDLPPSQTDPLPIYRARLYQAEIAGQEEVLLDYYVQTTDSLDNTRRSIINHVYVGLAGGSPGDTVAYWHPDNPSAGDTLAIYYDPVAGALPDNTDPVYIHIGHSGWQDILTPDPAMTYRPSIEYWKYVYDIPAGATSVDFVFTDGLGNWDNNNGGDWHVAVSGGGSGFVMDGNLDPPAVAVASNGGMTLWASWNGAELYVATQAAAAPDDRFILVAETPGSMRAAPWAKSGQVADWDAYLANEGQNGYNAWFDKSGTAHSAAGTYLEGSLNLEGELGHVPSSVWLAATSYQTADGGQLLNQAPASGDGDIHVNADEHVQYWLDATPPQAVTDLVATLAGNLLLLGWSVVTADTAGGPESVQHYVVYRGQQHDFVPTTSESIGATSTASFPDSNVVFSPMVNYFYLVKAVDNSGNKSAESARVGEFDRDMDPFK
jgi:hypothetical protein